MASASIEEAPVSRNARNLVIAMPVLARSAATTALVLPSVDMRGRLPGATPRRACPREQRRCATASAVDEPQAEVRRAVASAQHEGRVAGDLGVGVRCHRLHAYAVPGGGRLQPAAVLPDYRVVGTVVEQQQQR